MWHGISSPGFRKQRIVFLSAAFVCCVLFYISLPSPYKSSASDALHRVLDESARLTHSTPAPPSLSNIKSKYAYVTLLAVDRSHDDHGDIYSDNHFVGMRMLVYQTLHAEETKSRDIPMIILACRGASEAKKDRLRRDGAIVLDIEPVEMPSWIPDAANPAWADMFDKLRVWDLTQFDRVAYMDADVVLTKPLDGVFESVAVHKTAPDRGQGTGNTAGLEPPSEYVFAAGIEPNVDHNFPPKLELGDYERGEYVNAGFFVTKPSRDMLNYYLEVLNTRDAFSTEFREQDLLNHVHRLSGRMPWEQLDPIWNMHYPMQSDIDGGTHSLHAKWWNPHHRDLIPYFASWRWRMQGYYEAQDASTSPSVP